FSCRTEGRVDLERAPQRLHRLRQVLLILQAHREQVMPFGESIVERYCAAKRLDGERRLAVAVKGERELVQDVWRAIVEREVSAVRLGRGLIPAHGRVDVAQQLERASSRRVEG